MKWVKKSLGEIAPSNSNPLPSPSEIVWNLSLDEIEAQTGRVLSRTMCKVSELGSSKCCFDQRHILYSKLRPYLNKVVIPEEKGVGTSELIPLLPDLNKVDREFLAFHLRSPFFLEFSSRNTRGANLPLISMKALWNYRVKMPECKREQRRIVNLINECVTRVDEIELIRGKSNELSALRDSILRKAFAGEL
jgi:type I restriction enzyme, S subunit